LLVELLKFEIFDTEEVGVEARCWACILEMIGSNLSQDNGYPPSRKK
jgi:hypothetical protein